VIGHNTMNDVAWNQSMASPLDCMTASAKQMICCHMDRRIKRKEIRQNIGAGRDVAAIRAICLLAGAAALSQTASMYDSTL